jgi:hypothetical protein
MGKTGKLLKELSQNDIRGRQQYWKARMERRVASKCNYSEGNKRTFNNSIDKITLWKLFSLFHGQASWWQVF